MPGWDNSTAWQRVYLLLKERGIDLDADEEMFSAIKSWASYRASAVIESEREYQRYYAGTQAG